MRKTLGRYSTRAIGLTLHDLAELIRRAGHSLGLTVRSEYPANCQGLRNSRRLDWVWLRGGQSVVAFEIEGRNVAPNSLFIDHQKFEQLPAGCARILALYSVASSHAPQPLPPRGATPKQWVRNHWPGDMREVKVRLDTELMAPGGIEAVQALASPSLLVKSRRLQA